VRVAERRLYLLRHAKSSWKDHGLDDHERPLAGRGRRAAKAVRVEAELYGAGSAALLARLQHVPADVRSVMVIGHNPGLQELALLLARDGSEELEVKFPTAALATLAFRGPSWAVLDRGKAELIEFVRPRDLDHGSDEA
jgi:phosphohistidine phosphatase